MRAFLLSFSLFLVGFASVGQEVDLLPRGSEAIFKATFNVQGTKMTGFLAAKHTVVGVLHVEFTTPMGNNLITMKWEEGRWKQEYAVRQLKNKFVMETLGEDLKYILGYYIYDEDFLDLCEEWLWGDLKLIPDVRKGKMHAMEVYDKQDKLERSISYKYRNGNLSEVSVEHPNIPYSLRLETIDKK